MIDSLPDRAGRIADFARIYEITGRAPGLPMPFTGPDRAAYWFTAETNPEAAREAVALARRVFAEAFGVTFRYRDILTGNGMRRQYEAVLGSGVQVVLTAKAEHMRDEDAAEDAGEVVAA
jgi:hypothetical protein